MSTWRRVGGASVTTVVVRAAIVIGVIVTSVAVGVMVGATTAGVCTPGGVVVVSLTVGSRTRHDGWMMLLKGSLIEEGERYIMKQEQDLVDEDETICKPPAYERCM